MAEAPRLPAKPNQLPRRKRPPRDRPSSLPDELLVIVASYLSAYDNKQLRLTAKSCCRAATPHVFREVTLRIQEESFKNFFSIAFDEQLCQYPKTIIFERSDTRRNFAGPECFESSIDQRRRYNFNSQVPTALQEAPRHYLSEGQICELYSAYQKDRSSPIELPRGLISGNIGTFMGSTAEPMIKAMPLLTNLDSFVMSDKHPDTRDFAWRGLNFRNNHLCMLDFLKSNAIHQLSSILPFLSLNTHLKTLALRTNGRAFWIDKYAHTLQAFSIISEVASTSQPDTDSACTDARGEGLQRTTASTAIGLISSAFANLTALHLLVAVEREYYPMVMQGVGDLLCRLQKLKVLSIFFDTKFPAPYYELFHSDCECLPTRLSRTQLPHLEDLSLCNIVTSEEPLLAFFAGVGTTLRSLSMQGIQILPDFGFWDSILPRLRNKLKSIEQVDFASLTDDDPDDFEGFEPGLWQFTDSDAMADAVDELRAELFGYEPRRTFFMDAYQHYEKDMEDFLLRRPTPTTDGRPLDIVQIDYMMNHPENCDWCLRHAGEWQERKRAVRREKSDLVKGLGLALAATEPGYAMNDYDSDYESSSSEDYRSFGSNDDDDSDED